MTHGMVLPASTSVVGRIALLVAGALSASVVVSPTGYDPPPVLARSVGKLDKKGCAPSPDAELRATLVDTHSPARLPLDDLAPTQARFDDLLRDPVMGGSHATDPALLGLVRALAVRHPLAQFDVVSGFRSPRLNEALRKKGHHVASHSQHSLGHALDFRVVPDGASEPIDPRALAAEIRALGWTGGVGIYEQPSDRFVHADVGPLRTWNGM
jgi:uncharacterized protein YcbK (DUF882 family)